MQFKGSIEWREAIFFFRGGGFCSIIVVEHEDGSSAFEFYYREHQLPKP